MEKIKIKNEQDQIKFCLQMNCLACNLNSGDYEKCPHLANKIKARDKDSK